MATIESDFNRAFLPSAVHDLVVQPLQNDSVAAQVSTWVPVTERAASFRVPVVVDDPDAGWYTELEEIVASDGDVDEAVTNFYRLSGLTIISRELRDDSSPEAAKVIGDGLVRSLKQRLDEAFFGSRGANTKRPMGLGDLVGYTAHTAGTAWGSLDPFAAAQFGAQNVGAQVSNFVANPADALILSTLKEAEGSQRNLLQPDATQAGRLTIGGTPLMISPAVEVGTVWGIPKDRVFLAVRKDATVEMDESAFFTRYGVGILGTLRVGIVVAHAAAVQRITLTPPA